MNNVLSDCGAEQGHPLCQPSRNTAAMQWKVGDPGSLHQQIVPCAPYSSRPNLPSEVSVDNRQLSESPIPRLRICHTNTAITTQAKVAAPRTAQAEWPAKNRQMITANTTRPRLPIAEPAASTLAACLPLTVPLIPFFSFCCFSCFSIRVALAGKIAGKASRSSATRASDSCDCLAIARMNEIR
jgi:hypothetical protein